MRRSKKKVPVWRRSQIMRFAFLHPQRGIASACPTLPRKQGKRVFGHARAHKHDTIHFTTTVILRLDTA